MAYETQKRSRSGLCSLENLVRLDASRANGKALGATVYLRPNFLQIGEPSPTCQIMGVADVVAANRPFPANITNFCHCTSLIEIKRVSI
jgi:hypothetical protein